MRSPAGKRIGKWSCATFVVAVLILPAGASGEQARAGDRAAASWTRVLTLDLSTRGLGLRPSASVERLARAALARNATRLGLAPKAKLRLARRLRTPAQDGARALTHMRFNQTVGPLRVVWSQIDVTILDRNVRSINATVVPIKGRLPRKRRVSPGRALRVALAAVRGAEDALRPLAAAYAGSPTTDRLARRRSPRRAWVVEVQAPAAPGEEAPGAICVVVDAQTGEVIGRWPGMADRPDRGPQARGAGPAVAANAAQSQGSAASLMLRVAGPGQRPYANFLVTGDPRVARWPEWDESFTGLPRTVDLDAVTANASNVARTICVVRGYCGARINNSLSDNYEPWKVLGDVPGDSSRAKLDTLVVEISEGDAMRGNGDPNVPANDVIAHEFGHVMDWVYAGDRFAGGLSFMGREVGEALADMFAYDYDRGDATAFEESSTGVARDWANPGAKTLCASLGGCSPYPNHMDAYDSTPPLGDAAPHFNSTILSHAYYLFVQREGHSRAGRVLHNVPSLLSPRPTFAEVSQAFYTRAQQIYGAGARGSAHAAFSAVGLCPASC